MPGLMHWLDILLHILGVLIIFLPKAVDCAHALYVFTMLIFLDNFNTFIHSIT